jgi:ketosteroid isomerase-like protein
MTNADNAAGDFPDTADDALDRKVIERLLAYWSVQDVENTLSVLDDDVIYQVYLSDSALPAGGATWGKEAMRHRLYDFLAAFDCLHYEPVILDVYRGVARVQTQYVFRHRDSRERLSGSKRSVCELAGGLVVRVDEHHDAALVAAFARLTRWRLQGDSGRQT